MIQSFFSSLLNFINDNTGFIALIVGSFAIAIYIRQKREYRRNAAKLILQEIRYAEQNVKVARERKDVFLLSIKLLPTNTWYNNIHLFVKYFKETELDLISHFYSKIEYLDCIIETISKHKLGLATPEIPIPNIPQINMQQMDSDQENNNFNPEQGQQDMVVTKFKLNAEAILKDVTSQIEYLYNTPAVDKLRCISEKKWYHIL